MFVRSVSAGMLFILLGCRSEYEIRLARWHATVLDSAGVIFQRSNEECGVACAAMVLRQLGTSTITYESISAQLPRTPGGMSMRTLRNFFSAHRIPSTGLRLSIGDLRRLDLPSIVLVESSHFVLYDGFGPDGRVILRDPRMGRMSLELKGFERIWGGEALVVGRL